MANLQDRFGLRFFEEKVAACQYSCRLLLLNAQTAQDSGVQHHLLDPEYSSILASSNQSVGGPIDLGLVGLTYLRLPAQVRKTYD